MADSAAVFLRYGAAPARRRAAKTDRLPGRLLTAGWLWVLASSSLAMAAYLCTVAPGLSWRNGGADGGDLAAAVLTLGIPHPPGYPTYVLLGAAWVQLLPLGEAAYELTLLSAVGAALAATLAGLTVVRLARGLDVPAELVWPGAAVGALMLAFTPLLWSQTTIVEVYAPGLAVAALLGLLMLGGDARIDHRRLALIGVLGGLGLGLLPQVVLIAPGGFLLLASRLGLRRLLVRGLPSLVLGGLVGVSVFAYLPLRAAARPFVNWGDATTPAGFWELVTAAQYRYLFAQLGPTEWTARLAESVQLLVANLGLIGTGVGLVGSVALLRRDRGALSYLGTLIGAVVLFRTSYPAEGNTVYLLPALLGLAVLGGVGVCRLLSLAAGRTRRVAWVLATALLALPLIRAVDTAPQVTAAGDWQAEQLLGRVLAAAPPGALIVSERDTTTFGLWYRQALGDRPDVVVVDGRLLFHSWYRRQLAERYPDLEPAAVRPGGLTALGRPVALLDGQAGEESLRVVRPGRR